MDVWVAEERVRLAHSQAVRRQRTARGFEERSKQYLILILDNKKVIPFFLYSWAKWFTRRLSKSSSPRWVSLAVAAVGSLMIQRTFISEMVLASFVACI